MATKGIGRPLTILLKADTTGLAKGLQKAETQLQAFGKKTEIAARKATFALAGIGAAAFASVQSASDLNESISKSNVVFGNSAKAIQNWASTASTSLGLSQVAALEAAANFATLGQSAGLTGKELDTFSIDLTSLAADLASFNNTTTDEAITALAAGLRGESEPLRRFNVLLSDSAVQAKAVELGFDKTTQSLSDQDKVLIRNALILEQTTKQQGDFARTSDGAANQQRILAAQVENTRAKLGEGLLPVYQQILGALIPASTFFAKNSEQIVKVGTAAAVTAASFIALNVAVKVSIGLTKTLSAVMVIARTSALFLAAATGSAAAAQTLAEATYKRSTTALVLYNIAQAVTATGARIAATSIGILTLALLSNPITAVLVAVTGLITGLYLLKKQNEITATSVNSSYQYYGRGVVIFNKLNQSAANASNSINRVSNAIQEARDVMRSKGRNGLLDVDYTPDLVGLDGLFDGISAVTGATKDQTKATEDQTAAQKAANDAAKEAARLADILAKATDKAQAIANKFNDRLLAAREALANAYQAFKDYSAGVKSAITSEFNFGSAFEGKGKGSFIASLTKQANAAKAFAGKIAKLVKLGLSQAGVDQILAAGPTVGGAIADELLQGGLNDIKRVNQLVASVNSVATTIGNSTASAFYQTGITQGKALVAGIIQAAKDAGFIISGGVVKLPKDPTTITAIASGTYKPAQAQTFNITINGAVDPEGTRRSLEKMFQQSSRRTGAVNFAGATL